VLDGRPLTHPLQLDSLEPTTPETLASPLGVG
jgi:hypothetical protein